MVNYKSGLVLLIVFVFGQYGVSFAQLLKAEKLSLEKQAYTGCQLRVDGYYYMNYAGGENYSVYFLYKDGTILYGGGFQYSEFQKNTLKFSDTIWIKNMKEYRHRWGLFKIEGNKITFEKWYPSSGGPLPVYISSGEILNDTTFRITQSMRSNGKEVNEKNEVYHFKQFSRKPDSTNNFIK
ncbi:MAG: hypothetical protein A2W95_17860 [Bacteroidetes bacterium GWA2_40_14]|jgi:hypothetical protein|nr:MAG: hypothetical protein A2W95_17860 [Bacteroidetes bacterium GWA2_40_14]